MKKVGFFIYALLLLGSLCGIEQLYSLETLVVNTLEDKISLTPYLEYFIDKSGELDIDDLIAGAGDGLFKSPDKKILNLGYTRKPIWIRFSLDLSKYMGKEIILEIENELIQYIDMMSLSVKTKNKKVLRVS